MMPHILNPVEWTTEKLRSATKHVRSAAPAVSGGQEAPTVRRIGLADLEDPLRRGLADFGACRTDVIFLCLIYPIAGLFLARMAFDEALLPLLFPLASGFALIGPLAAVGLYEMSREREQGVDVNWGHAFGMLRAPSIGAVIVLGLVLLILFLLWLGAAQLIYTMTLGPAPPASFTAFINDVFTTTSGWIMIAAGIGVGFVFAVTVLAISVVSFPLLLDRDVSLGRAVATSVHAVLRNPVPMAAWGLIVAGGLVLGTLPAFLGLIIVIPVLGHATWHLYRKLVVHGQTNTP